MSDQEHPPLDQLADDEDELDGCSVEFGVDPTPDDQILEVVFGDDPRKWEEYRVWFAALEAEKKRDATPN